MSDTYYSQPPQRHRALDTPLGHPAHQTHHQQQHASAYSSSQSNMLASHHDGLDYTHFHAPSTTHMLQPYYDPYSSSSPANDSMRPSFSNSHSFLRNDSSVYSAKLMDNTPSDDAHELSLRATHFPYAKDENGRIGIGRGHHIEATDGILPDMPPDMDRLNPEQKQIMKQFPPDLDDLDGGKSGLQAVKDLLKDWKSWFKLKYLHWWVMLIVVIAIVVLTTIYHEQIVDWLTPISKKVTTVAWGWIIPVAILFIISFPPLFGHEIVLILVGLVYGIWIGFGIASLGTLLGEIGNFYAFKHCLRSMAANYERKNIHYACMAEMVRDGGFWVMFLARLSAIPGHFTTAVFATVGMNIFVFTFAAVLALPKQLLIVYLGVAIKNSGDGTEDTKSKIIKYVVLVISFIITVWTAYWLYKKMEKVRPMVSARLRQKRYELLLQARTPGTEAYSGQRLHTYPPNGGVYTGQSGQSGQTTSALDASYAYRYGGGADEYYAGYGGGDVSEDTYNEPGYRQMHASHARPPVSGQASYAAAQPAPPAPPVVEQEYPPAQTTAQAGREPIAAPMQFHRPIRQNSGAVQERRSPFRDPRAPSSRTDACRRPTLTQYASAPGARARHEGRADEASALTKPDEWASTSSTATSPVEGAPPEYTSFVGSTHSHANTSAPNEQRTATMAARVDASVQRYHLSD